MAMASGWEIVARKAGQEPAAIEAVTNVRALLKTHWPEMAKFQHGLDDDIEKRQVVLSHLRAQPDALAVMQQEKVLACVIETGNELRTWWMPITPYSVPLRRASSPHTPFNAAGKVYLEALDRAFWKAMAAGKVTRWTARRKNILCSQIVYSIMRHSGLLDAALLKRLAQADLREITVTAKGVFLDVPLSPGDPGSRVLLEQPVRRVYLHPVTFLLIDLWREHVGNRLFPGRDGDGSSMKLLKSLRKGLGSPTKTGARVTFKRLCGWMAYVLLHSGIPPYIVTYAQRWHFGVGVDQYNLVRIYEDCPCGPPPIKRGRVSSKGPATARHDDWRAIKDIIAYAGQKAIDQPKPSVTKLKKAIEASCQSTHGDADVPLSNAILRWAKERLDTMRSNNRGRGAATIAGELSALCELGDLLEPGTSLSTLDEDSWTDAYERYLAGRSVGRRHRLSRTIRLFHDFLVDRGVAPAIDYTDIDGYTREGSNGRPVLVTPAEYARLKMAIRVHPALRHDDRRVQMVLVIAILSTILGLRRFELMNLVIGDIQWHGQAMLLVREHNHSLKTYNAIRMVPLPRLSEEELHILRSWYQRRCQESGNAITALLFTTSAESDRVAKYAHTTNLVGAILKQVTGDPRAVIHWLRHCPPNWSLLAAEAMRLPSLLDGMKGFQSPEFDQERQQALARLVHVSGDLDIPDSVEGMYNLACFMGHSGPDVTLRHYLHVLDLILAAYLGRESRPLALKELGYLLDISRSQIYQRLGSAGLTRDVTLQDLGKLMRLRLSGGPVKILET